MDYRIAKDKIAGQVMFIMTIASILLVIAMTIGLFIKSEPILSQYHLWDLLTESNWRPMEGKFGFLPFLAVPSGAQYESQQNILFIEYQRVKYFKECNC